MNQVEIGRYIRKKRKENKLTQSELAEKLNITDRAISKWENGICMPDSSLIPKLCELLKISINDLFSGEDIDKKDNEKKLEKNLLEMYKQKEEFDKGLLKTEYLFMALALIFLFYIITACGLLVKYNKIEENLTLFIIIPSIIYFIFMGLFAIKIEQVAGYYLCRKCNHKYVPTYSSVHFSMHIGRTRYMKCPKCRKYSWNKKIISKGEDND